MGVGGGEVIEKKYKHREVTTDKNNKHEVVTWIIIDMGVGGLILKK